MSLYPPPLPWLSKGDAQREAAISIAASAAVARADIAALDHGDGEWWLAPGRRDRPWLVAARAEEAPFTAPEDTLLRALAFLGERRTDVPGGAFVFVLSDFLVPVPADAWLDALAHGWDIVPVVIQDPVWERSWPDVAGVGLPVAGAGLVGLGRRRTARLRAEHEERYAALIAGLHAVGLRPVELGTSDPLAVDDAFLDWADERRRGRWAR
jgi:hypothetical protein